MNNLFVNVFIIDDNILNTNCSLLEKLKSAKWSMFSDFVNVVTLDFEFTL